MTSTATHGVAPRARVLAPSRLEPELQQLWRTWCAESPGLRRAFLSLDFALAVEAVHPHVRVAVIYAAGVPSAFLPFQQASPLDRVLGRAERLGAAMSDYFGIVAAPGFRISSEELLRLSGLSFYPYNHLDETQLSIVPDNDTRRQTGLLIRLEDGPEAYWNDLTLKDKDFVQDTQRRERQLAARVGPLVCVHSTQPDPAPLVHLIEAKRRQYQATGVEDALAAPWTTRLLHQLLGSRSQQCAPFLSTLHAGDTWVASHFGLRFEERLHYWFPVYNPELKRYAPGRLLLKATIDAARDHGIRIIDRGEGESQAKLDFANDRHDFHAGAWSRTTLRATLTRALNSLAWRIQERKRRPAGDR
jgi:CelD/BcsL family acetyltransferase involved in cellulose biosynthesis